MIEVSFDKVNHILVVNWEGELSSDEIRKGYDILMEEVRIHKPKKLLLDLHNRGTIRRSDQRWVFSTVFPNILRTIGETVFVAIVLPVSLYFGLVGEMDGDELMHENNFLIIHHALYQEEAYRWLNTIYVSSTNLA
ncbi:hypothetical protein DXT99_02095 [Pontibacter diazotrophicus]|uniref:STAS/SEC14 domain-containing protein n=1 Tax=Pontibacter diazotrophicus TaxID=1400979 RepID=A0A3D8LHU7_9BACT|nr:hypothetical protein DXT99_02095 [Pontibacter diazotrophicus]